MKRMDNIYIALYVFVVLPAITSATVYSFEGKSELNNILINGDDVYIGAVNHIHRLNSNLAEIKSEKTGPVNDSRSCISRDSCPGAITTNNRNTLLLAYKEKSQLITCGSIFQGACQVRNLNSLQVELESTRPVTANDINSSTVGFISKSKLHLAVTLKDRAESLALPTVSKRILAEADKPRKFLLPFSDCKLDVNKNYVISYVSGFQLNDFAYFTSVQPVGMLSKTFHSKIIRYCINGINFYSYTEIPISCKDTSGIDYNILVAGMLVNATGRTASVLNVSNGETVYIGIFSKSTSESSLQTDNNAVCMFPMSTVTKAFDKNIEQCLRHGQPADGGLPWLIGYKADGSKCRANKNAIQTVTCGEFQYNRGFPQGGYIPLNHSHSFVLRGMPTSIHAYPHKRGLALFVGTADGKLLKYSLSSSMSTHLYGEEIISKGKLVKKIEPGKNQPDLYVMSTSRVVKFNVRDCSKRTNCIDCLAGPDCGWCTLANMCSLESECKSKDQAIADRPGSFVNDSSTNCPSIVSFRPKPAAVSARLQIKISWRVKNLPTLASGQTYKCSFGKTDVQASVSGDEYSCMTPKFGEIPGTSTNKSTIVVAALRSPVENTQLFTKQMVFFNCEQIQSCLECTRFSYSCNWCASSVTCMDTSKSCKTIIPHAGPDQSIELSKCPMIQRSGTQYLSSGASRGLTIFGSNFKSLFPYECQVKIDGNIFKTPATRENEKTLKCSPKNYAYKGTNSIYIAPVTVLFGGKVLDQVTEVKVTFYKCHVKRDGCGVCLGAPKQWRCGWCDNKSCTVSDVCPAGKQWANTTCPSPPVIIKLTPSSGAIYGNMLLQVEGRDLGTTSKDVENITVAGKSCHFLPSLYVTSKIVYCKTSSIDKPRNGTVQMFVKFGDSMVKVDSKKLIFMYKKPIISRFEPMKGPCSGGTKLTIFGNDLNVGKDVSVAVAGNECRLQSRYARHITCIIWSNCTSRRKRATSADTVVVSFDGHKVPPKAPVVFSVQPDPVVSTVNTYRPRTSDSQQLETFVSGGQVFIVRGKRFDLIQNPRMTFKIFPEKIVKFEPCSLISPEELNCLAPNVTGVTGYINDTQVTVQLGFAMQNVKSVQVIRNISVRGDPVFYKFDGIMDLQQNNLYLKGRNLDLLGNEDVNVSVAGLICVVQNIRERLFCNFPDKNVMENKLQKKSLVKVTVGRGGLEYTLGYARFVKNTSEKSFPWLYIYIVIGIGVVFITVILVLIILYRRRQKREKRYQKVNQTRLENLEAMYARECKEAFAELQIEMTDLTTDMSAASIPYLRFEAYAMRVLFPSVDTHPIMEMDCNKSDAWKRYMSSLCELLKEKEFLLIFIKTLESQQTFGMRDRCKLASLLIVALQDDMKYVTDILQELLADLIQKYVESGKPKLLLRRTESVAEKLLTNWLSYTLHDFVQHRVGEPLFRLFNAIVTLLDKEPVDAIACEARNSLSEDRLLRQKVDFRTITAHVEYERGDMVQVQLLDCDSIDQAKEKILKSIYKNVPFSQIPRKESLMLAYQTPTGGEKILHQEDSTCEIEGEWKRINTLEHFLIPDGCQLKLVSFSAYSDGTGTPGRLDVLHDTSLSNVNFAPMNVSTPMINHHNDDESFKLWHLVKPSDFTMEQKGDVRQNKMMAEIYLTRLLKTKGTLQNFVNDLFQSVFTVTSKGETIPPPMKFLFDFLDKQAALLNVTESEILHTWKNNCLPLKFWINVIKNPNFVFDVNKTSIADSCLSVIAQLFMDSCSPEEHRLGKDSPSNKLLYAKEIPDYKKKVARFYAEVKSLPPATDKELIESLTNTSDKYGETFNHYNAASEILSYAVKYKVKIMETLEDQYLEEYSNKLQNIMADLPDE